MFAWRCVYKIYTKFTYCNCIRNRRKCLFVCRLILLIYRCAETIYYVATFFSNLMLSNNFYREYHSIMQFSLFTFHLSFLLLRPHLTSLIPICCFVLFLRLWNIYFSCFFCLITKSIMPNVYNEWNLAPKLVRCIYLLIFQWP